MALKVLYTAHAVATGGRNGHTRSEDGIVDVQLSVPKAMGGPGKAGTTTPEDLFAAGYAACFGSATEFVGRMQKLPVKAVEVKAAVSIGSTESGGFGLQVALDVTVTGLAQEEAEKLVHSAHQVCPYSNATRNNVQVDITVHSA